MRAAESIIRELAERDLLELARRIAHEHHVTVEEMLSGTHARSATWPRHALWSELHDVVGFSLPRLGRLFGVHHTTILAGVRAHRIRIEEIETEGTSFDDRLRALEERLDDLERDRAQAAGAESTRRIA